MQDHIFRLAFSYPWTLCRRDLDAELDALADLPERPSDPVVSRIKSLLELEYNRLLLLDALHRLAES